MCDYSLVGVPNRLAQEGEDLVTYRFRTGSLGLAPAGTCTQAGGAGTRTGFWSMLKAFVRGEPSQAVAVCVAPGARLLLGDIPQQLQQSLGVGPAEEVTFTQLTATPHMYRDAFRFKNGAELLLQRLTEGQRVRILDCGCTSESPRTTQLEPAEL